jgi:hypothetical protein
MGPVSHPGFRPGTNLHHLARLARDLLAAKKYDASTTVLACYSAAGFDQDLHDQAARTPANIF